MTHECESGAGARLRILLADDFAPLLEEVASQLAPFFEVVGKVGDGQALVEAALRLQPDVIITDVSMPVLNGIQAVRKLQEAGSRSKIIFLTVHSDADIFSACLATGALGYVEKKRLTTDLLPAIREALAGRRFLSPSLPGAS